MSPSILDPGKLPIDPDPTMPPVGGSEAGLGGGLDQAEEAQLGITDEEIRELDESD